METVSGTKILVVDDSQLMLEVTKEALEAEGFEVLVADNMEKLEGFYEDPDLKLILMDVQMPELYGDDVAMVLRSVRGVSVPIVLYSNLPKEELATRSDEAEIHGYISKRDGIDAAVARVKEILAERT